MPNEQQDSDGLVALKEALAETHNERAELLATIEAMSRQLVEKDEALREAREGFADILTIAKELGRPADIIETYIETIDEALEGSAP